MKEETPDCFFDVLQERRLGSDLSHALRTYNPQPYRGSTAISVRALNKTVLESQYLRYIVSEVRGGSGVRHTFRITSFGLMLILSLHVCRRLQNQVLRVKVWRRKLQDSSRRWVRTCSSASSASWGSASRKSSRGCSAPYGLTRMDSHGSDSWFIIMNKQNSFSFF